MEFWFWSCWLVLVRFRAGSAAPDPAAHYTVHRGAASFERALQTCSLTTVATRREADRVLALVLQSESPGTPTRFTFWVGLRKLRTECGAPTLPLRGFKWTEDGSDRSEVDRWTEEPLQTCTGVLCAALRVESDGSAVTRWGLISVSCKTQNPFICKHRGTPDPPEPDTPGPGPAASEPPTPEPGPPTQTPEPAPRGPRPATQKPEPATPEREPEPDLQPTPGPGPPARGSDPVPDPVPDPGPDPGPDPVPDPGPDPVPDPVPDPGPDPVPDPGPESCEPHLLTGVRSLSPDPQNRSRIQVECWSGVQLVLRCSGRPPAWRLLNGAAPNLTAACRPCGRGFVEDGSGGCEDVDECGAAPCRSLCLNTPGSFSCVCADERGERHAEDSAACGATPPGGGLWAGLLPPLLIGAAALLLLLVVAAVTVKCCLMRRSKRRAEKEKVAMTTKGGNDPTNEKTAA